MSANALSRRLLKDVLCCAECDNPLHIDPTTGGASCVPCKYSPSMQDTFISRRCPSCNVQVVKGAKGGTLDCPSCGRTYA